jgi:hypothetical protein
VHLYLLCTGRPPATGTSCASWQGSSLVLSQTHSVSRLPNSYRQLSCAGWRRQLERCSCTRCTRSRSRWHATQAPHLLAKQQLPCSWFHVPGLGSRQISCRRQVSWLGRGTGLSAADAFDCSRHKCPLPSSVPPRSPSELTDTKSCCSPPVQVRNPHCQIRLQKHWHTCISHSYLVLVGKSKLPAT